MSKFVSHFHKSPVVGQVEEIDTLPVYSIIDADGVLYEKSVTPAGQSTGLFVELGHMNTEMYVRDGIDFADEISEGKVTILKVGH